MAEDKIYIAIDLKSFYASVECVERGLDPMDANLVVADLGRTEKTICLAVSPALKALGISGRPRLFEVVEQVRLINAQRRRSAPKKSFTGSSCSDREIKSSSALSVDYIVAPPRMALYIDYSTRIYSVYLKYIDPADIHIYSIDEVFIDATFYVKASGLTAHEFAKTLIKDVFATTGITATAGIGTNMYLCKISMDIEAKHVQPDGDGMRIAYLDEMSYRQRLWDHKPITDFWRVGKGIADKLAGYGITTMGEIARCSAGSAEDYHNEALLYKLFGVNAELLIDHAWGYEPCGIKEIKAYVPQSNSLSSGQVLQHPYPFDKAKLVTREMTELLVLDLVEKRLVTDQLVLTVGYDIENVSSRGIQRSYSGDITVDRYGRKTPKQAHGTANLKRKCSSSRMICNAVCELFDRIVDRHLTVRRITVAACRLETARDIEKSVQYIQPDLFSDYACEQLRFEKEEEQLKREKKMQLAVLDIKKKYGKNALMKGMNYKKGATARERNSQIGGHKA